MKSGGTACGKCFHSKCRIIPISPKCFLCGTERPELLTPPPIDLSSIF